MHELEFYRHQYESILFRSNLQYFCAWTAFQTRLRLLRMNLEQTTSN